MLLPARDTGLFTDLYELTMAASYLREGMNEPATFSLFIRNYPQDRAYFVAAGLETALEYLEQFQFSRDALAYLRGTGLFDERVLGYLSKLRFTGEAWAIPEGRIFFANEPLLEVTAPLIEAQLVETAVINACHLATLVATKAARCVHAAQGRPLVDFGLRRTAGADAGLTAARVSYMVGFGSTSNVLAGQRFGIPIAGTMAHSYIEAFPEERDAFRAFATAFPQGTTLLVDTYDTAQGVRHAVEVGQEMARSGRRLRVVRLDSGDLLALSKEARRILDNAGLQEVGIFASGGLDEFAIDELLRAGAPIDAFGVGTRMGTAADTPVADMAYKLVRYGERPVLKLSAAKETWPDAKQVWRLQSEEGSLLRDYLGLRDELAPDTDAEPLLERVMAGGKRLAAPTLLESRARFEADFVSLSEASKRLRSPEPVPVMPTPALRRLQEQTRAAVRKREMGE